MHHVFYRVSTLAGKAGEWAFFSEIGWKSWKTMSFSPALAGKAGIFYFYA